MKLTEQQQEFIKENYPEKVDEAINYAIDRDLTYYDDIQEKVNQFSNIVNCLSGEYTMDDLCEDLRNEYLDEKFDEIAEEIYEEYLDEEQRQEVDKI